VAVAHLTCAVALPVPAAAKSTGWAGGQVHARVRLETLLLRDGQSPYDDGRRFGSRAMIVPPASVVEPKRMGADSARDEDRRVQGRTCCPHAGGTRIGSRRSVSHASRRLEVARAE
jgi:transposase